MWIDKNIVNYHNQWIRENLDWTVSKDLSVSKTYPIENKDIYGQWTVLSVSTEKKYYAFCICSCGEEKLVYKNHLSSGKAKSCASCAQIKRHGNADDNSLFVSKNDPKEQWDPLKDWNK